MLSGEHDEHDQELRDVIVQQLVIVAIVLAATWLQRQISSPDLGHQIRWHLRRLRRYVFHPAPPMPPTIVDAAEAVLTDYLRSGAIHD